MKAPSNVIGFPFRAAFLLSIGPIVLSACATSPSPSENPSIDPEGLELLMGAIEEARVVDPPNTVRPDDFAGNRAFSELLTGLPGVWVTENEEHGISVRVRGISSIVGGQEPLFVLDGMVVRFDGKDIDGLDTRTIESISVLKNAGETAAWGSRGANGVIVIRTKKGS